MTSRVRDPEWLLPWRRTHSGQHFPSGTFWSRFSHGSTGHTFLTLQQMNGSQCYNVYEVSSTKSM